MNQKPPRVGYSQILTLPDNDTTNRRQKGTTHHGNVVGAQNSIDTDHLSRYGVVDATKQHHGCLSRPFTLLDDDAGNRTRIVVVAQQHGYQTTEKKKKKKKKRKRGVR